MNRKPAAKSMGDFSPPRWSSRLYGRIERKDIAFVRFVVEAHDNLALVSVVDKYQAVVRFLFAPGQENEVHEMLRGLIEAVGLEMIDIPPALPGEGLNRGLTP